MSLPDLMDRLRNRTIIQYEGRSGKTVPDPLCQEAADEIDRLHRLVEKLSKELDIKFRRRTDA